MEAWKVVLRWGGTRMIGCPLHNPPPGYDYDDDDDGGGDEHLEPLTHPHHTSQTRLVCHTPNAS